MVDMWLRGIASRSHCIIARCCPNSHSISCCSDAWFTFKSSNCVWQFEITDCTRADYSPSSVGFTDSRSRTAAVASTQCSSRMDSLACCSRSCRE
jgi:hypothetical protein